MYAFGPFLLDPRRRILLREQEAVPLTSKAFELLLILIEHRERVVLKDELLKFLWPRSVVEESNLTQNVFMVRKALGEGAHEHRYIVTVPGQGYRFAAAVREALEAEDNKSITAPAPSRTADGGTLARWKAPLSIAIFAAIAVVAGVLWLKEPAAKLSSTDTILIADFENRTGEPVFDGLLRQALSIELEQSPYLKILSDQRVADALRLMQRPVETPRTQAIALEVCQRENLKAVISGSIARLDRSYVLSTEAIACRGGDRIASAQARAGSPVQVIDALDQIGTTMRTRLGESLGSVERFDQPLRTATTASLDALKAFTQGADLIRSGSNSMSIPLLERAIALDPDFALAYAYLAIACANLWEDDRARRYLEKAYALRDHVSERERLLIVGMYHMMVSGDLDQQMATYQSWRTQFPRDWIPLNELANIYGPLLGNFAKEAEMHNEAWRLEPKQPLSPVGLAWDYLALDRISEARTVLERALAEKFDVAMVRAGLYRVAIMQGDSELADTQRRWSATQPAQENISGTLVAHLMQQGRMREAREQITQQVRSLADHGFNENAAGLVAFLALTEAEFGRRSDAAKSAAWSLSLARNRTNLRDVGLAFALAGEVNRAESILAELQSHYPNDFSVQRVYVPLTQAALALRRGNPQEAIAVLEPVRHYDLGGAWSFLPPYLRGMAYSDAQRGKEAAVEFQKIVDRRGIAPLAQEWALALVGLARVQAAAGDLSASRVSYQRVLSLWKNADPDLEIVQQIQSELRKLNQQSAGISVSENN